MGKNLFSTLLILITVGAIVAGCSHPVNLEDVYKAGKEEYEFLERSTTIDSEGVYYLDNEDGEPFGCTVTLGGDSREVFFIFTNPETDSEMNAPDITPSYAESSQSPRVAGSSADRLNQGVPAGYTTGVRDIPEISEFNRRAHELLEEDVDASGPRFQETPNLSYAEDESTYDFHTDPNTDPSSSVPATLRKIRSKDNAYGDKTKTLYVWVADDCWDEDSTKEAEITQTEVDLMADSFLDESEDAIYEWVTGIFGEEWGNTSYSNLISAEDEVHILLYDIGGDNSKDGGVLGYFWSKDNIDNAALSDYEFESNERVMFYMDAVLFATEDWQDDLLSTLAHEFQHMIHFYQKNILQDTDSDIWLNEMASMAAEDLVADKLGVAGPRGVGLDGESFVYDSGFAIHTGGRLPLFNYYNFAPLTTWLTGDQVSISYSVSYAFGAFLARHYGGSDLLNAITQNDHGDYQAVVEAVNRINGTDYSFGDILRHWGASVVLSDEESSMPNFSGQYGYNRGGRFSESGYSLGSIDLHKYASSHGEGPWFCSLDDLDDLEEFHRGANVYVELGSVSGEESWEIDMPEGMNLTVIVRD